MKGLGSTDAYLMFRGLVATRRRVEFPYHRMISDSEEFVSVWGVLCSVVDQSLVLNL